MEENIFKINEEYRFIICVGACRTSLEGVVTHINNSSGKAILIVETKEGYIIPVYVESIWGYKCISN